MAAEDSDDDVFDNWEDLVDTGALEKKLEIMKPKDSAEECTNCRDSYVCTEPVILQGDSCRTQFVQAQPRVKILKRPSGGRGGGGGGTKSDGFVFVNGERVQKQPIKTLQQREAEYAQARLRILGAAKSDEEIAEEKLAKLTIAPSTTDSSTTDDVPCRLDAPGVSCTTSAAINYVTESGTKPAPINLIQVSRPPRGPDGTAGFTQFR